MKVIEIDRDPNESWALVELFLWQYGELPQENNQRELDIKKALISMSDKLMSGDSSVYPNPFNVGSVLKYIATTKY